MSADAPFRLSRWIPLGALLAGLAVAAGALGAHGLDGRFQVQYRGRVYSKKLPDQSQSDPVPLAAKRLADFRTGTEYHMAHALALLVVGLLAGHRPGRLVHVAGGCFLAGIALFSGGLYGLAVFDQPMLGASIVPIGGVLFIVGWLCLMIAAISRMEPD